MRVRRGLALLLLGLLFAALGVTSARASGDGTTTSTTTTTTTTTTPAPSYAPLASSVLPAGCVGAGAAAVVPPSHSVVALGTPASNLGPSGYPASDSVVAFGWSSASGSTCRSAQIALGSVSLFGGAVTAESIAATDGRGTVSGLEIDGAAVAASAGETVSIEGWGQLTLGATVGRLTAPLVIRLLQARNGLSAGTTISVAFAAAPLPAAQPEPKHRASSTGQKTSAAAPGETKGNSQQPRRALDFPASPVPFKLNGRLARAAQGNPVVSTAMQYLGVPYQWGGASPKAGFDCSGLVMYVFAQLGVSLPHYAAAQWHSPGGVWVAPNRLQAGDLVFFTGEGTRREPGHVGIYVGDGYFIDAPRTGSFVRIDSLSEGWFANNYVGGRRIVSPLHARHLLHANSLGAYATDILPRLFSQQMALGNPPVATAAFRSASSGYPLWAGAPPGVLLIMLLAGALFFRRRRTS